MNFGLTAPSKKIPLNNCYTGDLDLSLFAK